jgi:transcriptional regulator of NAD metabolism
VTNYGNHTLLVDLGLHVRDEAIAHPVCGPLRVPLDIASREDVRVLAARLAASGATLLCTLTGGVHTHTVEAARPELLQTARQELRRRGFWREEERTAASSSGGPRRP